MKKESLDKLTKINELQRQRDQIDAQLESLLNPTPKIPLPANFSVNDKILEILKQFPEGKSAKEILSIIQTEQPAIERPKVNAALIYLSGPSKNLVDRAGRGFYKLKVPTQN